MQVLKVSKISKDFELCRKSNHPLGIYDCEELNLCRMGIINDQLKDTIFPIICKIRDEFTDVHPRYFLTYKQSRQRFGIYVKNKDYSNRFFENDGTW